MNNSHGSPHGAAGASGGAVGSPFRPEDLPPLNPLVHFVLAARTRSFTEAAEELGVGQSAVSHAVRQLERHVGRSLFVREHRGVTLTPEGQRLAEAAEAGFATVTRAMRDIAVLGERASRVVTISVSTATATYWLVSRLASFKLAHPELEVRVITSDTNAGLDLALVDLFIPVGQGDWSHLEHWPVADELIYPVCSPEFAKRIGSIPVSLQALTQLNLLHLEERHPSRMNWGDWFRRLGVDPGTSEILTTANDYSVLVQEALLGQGIVIGWDHIVNDLVEQGRLVRPVVEELDTGKPFFVYQSDRRPVTEAVAALRDWLQDDAN